MPVPGRSEQTDLARQCDDQQPAMAVLVICGQPFAADLPVCSDQVRLGAAAFGPARIAIVVWWLTGSLLRSGLVGGGRGHG
jgi:hypothetical protein